MITPTKHQTATAFLSIMSTLFCLVLGVAAQRPQSQEQLRRMRMYARQTSGALSELTPETAVLNNERTTAFSTPRNIVVCARLPGGKATLRFRQGEPVEIIAHLPAGTEPHELELRHFESHGPTRLVYLQTFGAPASAPHWNTVSFRVSKKPDQQWTLQPAKELAPGEYCFSPRFNNENFCFGVDPQ